MITVNLELSKQLKEAGYPQREGKFFWFENSESDIILMDTIDKSAYFAYEKQCFASPTADEILEQIKSYDMNYQIYWNKKEWIFCFFEADICFRDAELANAIARMFLYLKQNNLLQKEVKG